MAIIHISDEQYQHMAFVWGLNYDMENKVIYGERKGYPFLVYPSDTSAPLMFQITTSVKSESCSKIGKKEKKLIKDRAPMLVTIAQRNSKIIALSDNVHDIEAAKKNVDSILDVLVSFMKEKGFMPCCEECKRSEHTEILQIGFDYRHLCSQCEERIAAQSVSSNNMAKEDGVKEIGCALIGAVMGIAFMAFLVSRVGSILTLLITGGMVGAFTIKLGMCTGGRPSKAVRIAVAVIAVLAVFVGYNTGYIMAFMKTRDMSLWIAAKTYIVLMLAGMANIKVWVFNLVIAYIGAIVGGIISYRSESKNFGSAYKIAHIGRHKE